LLAGFRCVAADLLWLRATNLQDQGSYFELVQLADWITQLEPHFVTVWAVQAWNMAYNIGVMMPDEESSWRWVENGIRLLRDRGIPANADNPYLYSELAFMFSDKLSNQAVPQSKYYTTQWVKAMMRAVGKCGHPDYAALAAMPERTRQMVEEYKLLPDVMREIDSIYGPLDWRLPYTHALYWAYLGSKAAGDGKRDVVCERMIYQSMAALFNSGLLTVSDNKSVFVTSVNFELLPRVIAAFERAVNQADDDLPGVAYKNFLAGAVRTLAFYHRKKEAESLFYKLAEKYPSAETGKGFDEFVKHAAPVMPQILNPGDN
jgi:hypothetical protein